MTRILVSERNRGYVVRTYCCKDDNVDRDEAPRSGVEACLGDAHHRVRDELDVGSVERLEPSGCTRYTGVRGYSKIVAERILPSYAMRLHPTAVSGASAVVSKLRLHKCSR